MPTAKVLAERLEAAPAATKEGNVLIPGGCAIPSPTCQPKTL